MGMPMSQLLRQQLAQAAKDKGLLNSVAGQSETEQNMSQMANMAKAAKAGDPREALRLYDNLPEKMKNDRSVLGLRLVAAQQIGGDTYTSAMEALPKRSLRTARSILFRLTITSIRNNSTRRCNASIVWTNRSAAIRP